LSEITELKYTSLIKCIIIEENFKWHLEAFGSELFILFHNVSGALRNTAQGKEASKADFSEAVKRWLRYAPD